MRFSFTYAAVAALTTSAAYSQSIAGLVAQIPSCAVACLAAAATHANCGISDYSCQCGDASSEIADSAVNCLSTSCSLDAAGLAISLSEQICNVVGCKSSSSSVVHHTGSAAHSSTPSAAPSSTPSANPSSPVTTPASPTTAVPARVTSNAASKLGAGAAVAGAVVLAAMAL